MITSEREAWLWVHDFIELYLKYQECTSVEGIRYMTTIIDQCRIHRDRTKLQEGADLSLKSITWRISGICGVLSLLQSPHCEFISKELKNRMTARLEKHAGGEILGYLFPCTPKGKIQRLKLCKKFAEECES